MSGEGSAEHSHELGRNSAKLTSNKRLREATKKINTAARWAIVPAVCMPFRCLCCVCTSFGGILTLMRSETTREFALAVVIGNVFNSFCNDVASFVVGPLVRLFLPPYNDWTFTSMAFIQGAEALQLSGGRLYSNPNDTRLQDLGPMESAYKDEMVAGVNDPVAAARADGAKLIAIQSIIDSLIGFVVTLLNICARRESVPIMDYAGWCCSAAFPHACESRRVSRRLVLQLHRGH
jgi:hypothetical protein